MSDVSSPTAKPLAGLRVLELARVLAGPWAGQLLADLGADVIKVERPGRGDDTRAWGPPFIEDADGQPASAAYFHAANRGKRSVALDIASAAGQRTVRDLAAAADVVIENFKVGDLARYGLDAASLRGANPRLVYCSITGFGQTGPYAHRAGYDAMIQGLGGIMDLTGEPDGAPQRIGVAMADLSTGLYAVVAILAALRARDASGDGATIDMALLDVQASLLANQALNYFVSGTPPKRLGNGHPNLVPYQAFAVSDGHVIVAVGNDAQFRRFCATLGCEGLADDAAYATNAARIARREELVARLSGETARFTREGLLAALEAAGVPAGPINDLAQVFEDPQVRHRGLRRDLPGPQGSIPTLASPIVLDGMRMVADRPSPRLGADEPVWLDRDDA